MYRLKPKYVPTALIPPGERGQVTVVPYVRPRRRSLHVPLRLLTWALHALWLWITVRDEAERARAIGVAARRLAQELGYLWIKAGQLVSVREDLLPVELCTELSHLQWQASGFPALVARQTIEQELGAPVDRLFARFDDVPTAAASIAQVHHARLWDGTEVVVKVMRPDSREIFLADMAFFQRVVRLMSRLHIAEFARLEEVVWELDQMMREEVDFRFELSNLKRMRKRLRRHHIYVPKPYARLSTERVLVMEHVPGVLMSDYIRIRTEDPERADGWLKANDIKPARVGRRLYLSFLRQMIEDNLFHGDLHPGNIMLLRESRIALIDLGTVGTVERAMLNKYVLMIKAIAHDEYDRAVDLVLSLVPELPAVNLQPLREDMLRALRAWAIRTPIKSIPYHQKSLMQGLMDVMRIMAGEQIVMTWSFLRIIRSRGNMATSISHLVPQLDQPKLYRRYFRQRQRRMLREMARPRALRGAMMNLIDGIAEIKMYLDPMIRRASRMFSGGTSKLADVGHAAVSLVGKGLLATVVVMGLVGTQAHYPQVLARVPWLARTLRALPGFAGAAGWLARHSQALWIGAMLAALYVFWTMVRPLARRLGEDEVRLPDRDRA